MKCAVLFVFGALKEIVCISWYHSYASVTRDSYGCSDRKMDDERGKMLESGLQLIQWELGHWKHRICTTIVLVLAYVWTTWFIPLTREAWGG